MKRASCSVLLRLCLAVLPVLLLLAGGGAQAFGQGQATAIVICADGGPRILHIPAGDGTPAHNPRRCRDCAACTPPMPSALPPTAAMNPPAARCSAVDAVRVADAAPMRRVTGFLSRGPPSGLSRFFS